MQDLVHRFDDELWNAGCSDMAHEILHGDLRFRGSLGPEHEGPDGFLAYRDGVLAALSAYRCDIIELIAEGLRAAARMMFHGIHSGRFMGAAPTGRRIAWAGAAFFVAKENRLARIWVLGDTDSIRRQPAKGEAP